MDFLKILAILISLTAIFSYFNHRYIGLPVTIGVMLIALAMSLGLHLLDLFGFNAAHHAERWLSSIDFNITVLHGMLSFLLFAGALHVDINDLAEWKWSIAALATIGTLISTFLVGTLSWWIVGWIGVALPYVYCLLFGALISPTDPIAVLGILKTAKAPKNLEIKITGESLFNDGIGIVVFLVIFDIATGTHAVSAGSIIVLFAQETIGGAVFGLGCGYLTYRMLKTVNNYQVEILLTLALVSGGYALATALHVSGPITIVVAGLLIGNHGRLFGMSEETRHQLDLFWELLDEVLNAILFVLIGLEMLVLTFSQQYLIASLLLVPCVLFARFVAIGIPVTLLRLVREFSPGTIRILTWGGLRGGISVALALSLPPGPERHVIVAITYVIVIFSIAVQGLTIERVIGWTITSPPAAKNG